MFKTLDLNSIGLIEMDHAEMQEVEGGFIFLLLAVAAVVVLGGCATTRPLSTGPTSPGSEPTQPDSTGGN